MYALLGAVHQVMRHGLSSHTVGIILVKYVILPIVRATYFLEGDGPTVLFTSAALEAVATALAPFTAPPPPATSSSAPAPAATCNPIPTCMLNELRTHGITSAQDVGRTRARETLLSVVNEKVGPVRAYWTERIATPVVRRNREFYHAVAALNPHRRITLSDDAVNVIYSRCGMDIGEEEQGSYNEYLATAHPTETPGCIGILTWWDSHRDDWPVISEVVRYCATATPTSAASERAGSSLGCNSHKNQLKDGKLDLLRQKMGRYTPDPKDLPMDSHECIPVHATPITTVPRESETLPPRCTPRPSQTNPEEEELERVQSDNEDDGYVPTGIAEDDL